MLLGGAVAGQGAIDIYLLIAIAWFAAWAGDTTSFFIGRRLGREFVLRTGRAFGISHERFEKVEDYFSRHGGKTIFIGRFIGLVRAFAPFIAGSSGMRYRAFVPYSILGTGLWASAHILVGYFFSRSIDTAAKYAGRGAFVLGDADRRRRRRWSSSVRHFRVEENRRAAVAWMERTPRPAGSSSSAAASGPQLRFLWDRVTPGGTFGLEFTSLMAVLAVALFVLVAYTVIVSGEPGPDAGRHHGDRSRRTAAHAGWLTDVAKVVTAPRLGRGHLAAGRGRRGAAGRAPALGRVRGAARRRWRSSSSASTRSRTRSTGRARRRPVGVSGSSFPSGHAAYSIFYVWLAVTIVMRLRPGMARGAARGRGGDRADRAGRPLARLPRRPLPQRRQRRLGARRRRLLALRGRRAGHHPRAPECSRDDCRWRPGRRSGMSTCCSARAGLVSLVAFVALILVPALGSYGRIWEKAAAGVPLGLRPRRPGPGRRRDRPRDRLLLQRHRQSASTASSLRG